MVSGLVFVAATDRPRADEANEFANEPVARVPGPLVPGTNCPAFPANNVWNTPITTLPVAVNRRRGSRRCPRDDVPAPDYGPSGNPTRHGHPWTVVHKNTVFAPLTFQYASESDRGARIR